MITMEYRVYVNPLNNRVFRNTNKFDGWLAVTDYGCTFSVLTCNGQGVNMVDRFGYKYALEIDELERVRARREGMNMLRDFVGRYSM
jgi:hypothetical protein